MGVQFFEIFWHETNRNVPEWYHVIVLGTTNNNNDLFIYHEAIITFKIDEDVFDVDPQCFHYKAGEGWMN